MINNLLAPAGLRNVAGTGFSHQFDNPIFQPQVKFIKAAHNSIIIDIT